MCQIREDRNFSWDSYVVGFVYLYNCYVAIGKLEFVYSLLPVDVIAKNMTNVGVLGLVDCTVSNNVPEFSSMASRLPNKQLMSTIHKMYISNVQGMRLTFTHIFPDMRLLLLSSNSDVFSLEELSHAFPKVSGVHV